MEAIDVSAGEYPDAYALSGERVEVSVDGEPKTGNVVYVRTGEVALDELESRVQSLCRGRSSPDRPHRRPPDRRGERVGIGREARWPKRPKRLARRLHGDAAPRFTRP